MKKVLFIICTIAFASCSKDEDSSSNNIKHNTANFTLSKNIERADWSNIQTGETLKIDLKIEDFDTDPNAVYILKPITSDATRHQKNKIDYNFQEEVKVPNPNKLFSDSIVTKKTQDSIIIKKAKSSFFVSVLKPGNFSQQYELRKMYLNKFVAGSTEEILFSAIKLDVYTWNEQTDNGTMFSNSKHSRYYEFTIDDGDQTNDTYLTDSDNKQNTYSATYNGKKYTGNVVINKAMTFSDKVNTEKGAQIVPVWTLSELKITQKRNNEPDNIIIYNNLNITQK